MLRAGILVLVAGCRGLLGIEEAQILDSSGAPDDGAKDDAAIDPAIDAAPPIACPQAGPVMDVMLGVTGKWMSVDPGTGRATKLDPGDLTISIAEGNTYNGFSATYLEIFASATGIFDGPRLSPDGAELYVVEETPASVYTLKRSTRVAAPQAWSVLEPVTLKAGGLQVVVQRDDVPSTVTSTNPRRMIMSRANSYDEYIETTPTNWARVVSLSPSFGSAFLGQAMLSPDGLKLVFAGQSNGNPVAAYLVQRSSVQVAFSGVAVRLPGPGTSITTPFLTGDCKHLYYANLGDNQLHHLSYP